jgi:hypothetical protein
MPTNYYWSFLAKSSNYYYIDIKSSNASANLPFSILGSCQGNHLLAPGRCRVQLIIVQLVLLPLKQPNILFHQGILDRGFCEDSEFEMLRPKQTQTNLARVFRGIADTGRIR